MEKHYSVKALAQLWGVPERTIRKWFDTGALKRTYLCCRVVVAESEALRFMRDSNAKVPEVMAA